MVSVSVFFSLSRVRGRGRGGGPSTRTEGARIQGHPFHVKRITPSPPNFPVVPRVADTPPGCRAQPASNQKVLKSPLAEEPPPQPSPQAGEGVGCDPLWRAGSLIWG